MVTFALTERRRDGDKKPKAVAPAPGQAAPKPQEKVYEVEYGKAYTKALSKLGHPADTLIPGWLNNFLRTSYDHAWRQQKLLHAGVRGLFSVDLGHVNSTLYKLIYRRRGDTVCIVWVGTHQDYDNIIESDWIRKQ